MLQFIYNHAPIAFQNLMISIKGKQLIKQRYTSYYYDELKRLRNCQDPFELQQQRMKEFYKYIKNKSNFHSKRLMKFNNEIDIDNLEHYPVLEKEDIRNNIDEIITGDPNDLLKSNRWFNWKKSEVLYK